MTLELELCVQYGCMQLVQSSLIIKYRFMFMPLSIWFCFIIGLIPIPTEVKSGGYDQQVKDINKFLDRK